MEWRKNRKVVLRNRRICVLILVLMEWRKDLLWDVAGYVCPWVLILVLMEWRKNSKPMLWLVAIFSGFNPCSNGMKKELKYDGKNWTGLSVLILVLMEWRKNLPYSAEYAGANCFNPCSNGMKKERYFMAACVWFELAFVSCFNPCSNGMKKERRRNWYDWNWCWF